MKLHTVLPAFGFIWALGSGSPVFGQQYQPGYIITNEGDTIKGKVDIGPRNKSLTSIHFVINGLERVDTYNTTDIAAFGTEGQVYKSASFDIDPQPTETSLLTFNKDQSMLHSRGFVREVASGPKSLYTFTDNTFKKHYYIHTDSTYDLLVFRRFKVYKNKTGAQGSTIGIGENKAYVSQLMVYFAGCPAVVNKLNNTLYNERSLASVFATYYENCAPGQGEIKLIRIRHSQRMGIIAGLSASKIDVREPSGEIRFMEATNYPVSRDFTCGVFYERSLPWYKNRWALNAELLWYRYHTKGSYVEKFSSQYNTVSTSEMNGSLVRGAAQLLYTIPMHTFDVQLEAGVFTMLFGTTSYHETIVKTTNNVVTTEEREGSSLTNPSGFALGAGISKGRWKLTASTEVCPPLYSETNRSFTYRGYLKLGYAIFSK
ncbi:MAG: hypothetical protein H6585_07525 [Flavobacteriales bacterium]|nr:hypothetical protein [Flavobacteriales bacterium]MCB9448176.1 hypothetical protein [Flavobacteriales bacterium]